MPVPCMPCSQEVATAAGPNLRGGHMARGMGRLTAAVSAVGQLPRQPETYKGGKLIMAEADRLVAGPGGPASNDASPGSDEPG